MRVSDRILTAAGALLPLELPSLDAIDLATAQPLGDSLHRVVTYDARLTSAARAMGSTVVPQS